MTQYWVWLALGSGFFIIFQRIIQKKVLNHEHASQYLTTFFLLTWIFLLPFIPFFGLDFHEPTLKWILLKSFLFGMSSLYIIRACRHMEISLVEPLRNLAPLFILGLAILFLREIPTLIQFFGVFLLVVGAVLLEHKSFTPHVNPFKIFKQKYFHYLLIAFVIGGASATLDKIIVRDVSTFTTIFFLFLFTSIILFIYQSYAYKGIKDVQDVLKKDGVLLSIIVIFSIISDWIYFTAMAIPEAPLSLVIPLRKSSVIFVVVFGGEFFKEKNILAKSIACVVTLVGVFFIAS